MMLTNRIQQIKPSATLAINAKAIEMQKAGIDVLKFGTGEPDFDTPDNIKQAAKLAIEEGFTKYTAATGIKELKEAICHKLKRDNQIKCEVENVLVTNGGKQALFNLMMAVIEAGDEVLVPAPYWVSYADMIRVCGGQVKTLDTRENRFKLTAEMVSKAITPKTKLLILNSPSNPTGAVIERSEIELIGMLALKHGIKVISDEVYEYFLYDGKSHFSLASIPELRDLVFTVNAVSKTYSMTGWRVGYIVGPKEVIKAMGNLQSHSTSNPCSIAQKAALEAITGPQNSVGKMARAFSERREFVHEAMNAIPGFKLEKPEGAFYAFPNVSGCFNETIKDSFDFASFLLDHAKVAVVPGGAFGIEGGECIRFSYAASMESIEEGLKRIENVLTGKKVELKM